MEPETNLTGQVFSEKEPVSQNKVSVVKRETPEELPDCPSKK